jgi:hypothetical protein
MLFLGRRRSREKLGQASIFYIRPELLPSLPEPVVRVRAMSLACRLCRSNFVACPWSGVVSNLT